MPAPWPNEPDGYRAARERLLDAEAALRAQIETVAEMRRALPDGGPPPEDYVFADARDGAPVRLSELFGPGRDTLVLYSLMFAPGEDQACPMCSAMLDSLDGAAPHVTDRVSLAVAAKASPYELRNLAAQKGWRRLRLVSTGETTYNRDYRAETADGDQLPMLHVWTRRDGELRHFWASELFEHVSDWQHHPRHVDAIWPLWNVFDLTPEGRGADWFPRHVYR